MEDDDSEDETPDVLAAAEASADDADDADETEHDAEEVDDAATEEEPAEEPAEVTEDAPDYASLKVAELKELLKAAGKPVSGKKAELIARLQE
jgi:uncharacterized membrane protein YdbT with pleckstrin-like domain